MNRPATLTGGCQCGQVRYRITGSPQVLYACHCRDCQKQSSSAFGLSLWVAPRDFELHGSLRFWHTRADSGAPKICAFCETCGSRIYHATDDVDAVLSIKAGSLDDTSWLRPVAHLWTRRAQPWLRLDGLCFEGEPDDEAALVQAWRERNDFPRG